MHIGLLIYGDIDSVSGGYLYDRKLVEFLRKQGDEVDVISLGNPSWLEALFTSSIPAKLKAGNFDILIQDELAHPSCLRMNKTLSKVLNCPLVSLVHLFNYSRPVGKTRKWLYRHIEKKYIKTVDALILNSESTKMQAEILMGSSMPPNIVAVPCGDNFEATTDTPVRNTASLGGLSLLYVGNITRQKNLHVIIEAMALADNKEIILTVVGNEEIERKYVKKIRHEIRQSGLDAQVNFQGVLRDSKLKAMYQSHDLFVLPSENEAYGIAFLEAMQFALPVIGTRSGGAMELIREGENGFLIQPGAGKELAEKLNVLHKDRELLQKLSDQAGKAYSQHPVWDDSCGKIRGFLQGLIEKRSKLIDQ